MQRRDVASAAAQAAAMGALAAWLTVSFTNPLGIEWATRDSVFVLAVAAAVFYSRLKSMKLEQVVNAEHHRLLSHAHALERLEFVHGEPVQIEPNKITCLLFFGSWCAKSRAALQQLERLHDSLTHGAVQFVALTQESHVELAMYEAKGRNASNFRELKEFPFAIAIEDGLMSKEYLVRCDLFDVPQLFIVGKDGRIMWYGDPATKGVEDIIHSALKEENVESAATLAKDEAHSEQALAS